jgi:preprotein translocase subunit SecG
MNLIMAVLILAQRQTGRVRGIRESFGSSGSEGGLGNTFLLLVSAALVLILAYAWLRSRRSGRPVHSAMKLFQDSLRSLGFSGEEKYLLERMVRELHLRQPAQLLMDASMFDELADKMVAQASKAGQARMVQCLINIRRKAFTRKR